MKNVKAKKKAVKGNAKVKKVGRPKGSVAVGEPTKQGKARLDLIGERLVEMRRGKKIKQKELASQLDISGTHLRNMEKGKIFPRLPILIKLINMFDINPNYLFLEGEKRKKRYLVE